ncbi:signal transduction histidine kinase [Actinomadura coerulea]|uniref:histidine kinase n=1 Tax=Actinomadura coerulea TaxID=46159 RepID=A0A7X0G080_9ACTN|nr:ATP-binding protein [Actinomadura coerulea]MBB6396951.1 signal transduction histidine kinase [Actinomadura coerulea]GGP95570.1 sensor histidine kinase [Actinomadura coerulea]
MAEELLRLGVGDDEGVFALRQAGRHVAAAVRLDFQDQVRVATALSEIGRELVAHCGKVAVAFRVDRRPAPRLLIDMEYAPVPGAPRSKEGDTAAARLMDLVEETGTQARRTVRLAKNLPADATAVTGATLTDLRARLGRLQPATALEELRTQNAELLRTLEDVRRQSEELRALNTELEETNQGVMALYNELSTELEETNRGVVALYAELEEKSDQLREAGEAKNRFWANISHELRTPVNGVIGLARLLLDPAAEPLTEEQRHQVSLIAGASETLLSLVNELLDMAKAEQGRLAPRRTFVEVPSMLRQLADLMTPMAEQSGVRLRVEPAEAGALSLVTDEVMLTRVLRNLVANGLKFTDEGEVRLTTRRTPGHLEFLVTDTGIGIPPGEQERVFEEFYQVPGGKPGGTGLGLTYSRRLAQALGGDLTLESEVGAGTTVTLRLPPYQGLAELGLAHVLVADGHEAGRRVLRDMIGDAAERVSEAGDPGSVRDLAASGEPPELILLGPDISAAGAVGEPGGPPPGTAVVLIAPSDAAASDGALPERVDAVLDQAQLAPVMLADAVARARAGRTARTP